MKPRTLLDKIKAMEAERADPDTLLPSLNVYRGPNAGVTWDPTNGLISSGCGIGILGGGGSSVVRPKEISYTQQVYRAHGRALSAGRGRSLAILCSPKWYMGLMDELSSIARTSWESMGCANFNTITGRTDVFGMPVMVTDGVQDMVIADIQS